MAKKLKDEKEKEKEISRANKHNKKNERRLSENLISMNEINNSDLQKPG